ncbi:hypothetical protein HanIR_Chr03g0143511 [Helianthus annuus]|nr:hypothetical protein HanIR_Chr03g0143511 [Helianthus annuus]
MNFCVFPGLGTPNTTLDCFFCVPLFTVLRVSNLFSLLALLPRSIDIPMEDIGIFLDS